MKATKPMPQKLGRFLADVFGDTPAIGRVRGTLRAGAVQPFFESLEERAGDFLKAAILADDREEGENYWQHLFQSLNPGWRQWLAEQLAFLPLGGVQIAGALGERRRMEREDRGRGTPAGTPPAPDGGAPEGTEDIPDEALVARRDRLAEFLRQHGAPEETVNAVATATDASQINDAMNAMVADAAMRALRPRLSEEQWGRLQGFRDPRQRLAQAARLVGRYSEMDNALLAASAALENEDAPEDLVQRTVSMLTSLKPEWRELAESAETPREALMEIAAQANAELADGTLDPAAPVWKDVTARDLAARLHGAEAAAEDSRIADLAVEALVEALPEAERAEYDGLATAGERSQWLDRRLRDPNAALNSVLAIGRHIARPDIDAPGAMLAATLDQLKGRFGGAWALAGGDEARGTPKERLAALVAEIDKDEANKRFLDAFAADNGATDSLDGAFEEMPSIVDADLRPPEEGGMAEAEALAPIPGEGTAAAPVEAPAPVAPAPGTPLDATESAPAPAPANEPSAPAPAPQEATEAPETPPAAESPELPPAEERYTREQLEALDADTLRGMVRATGLPTGGLSKTPLINILMHIQDEALTWEPPEITAEQRGKSTAILSKWLHDGDTILFADGSRGTVSKDGAFGAATIRTDKHGEVSLDEDRKLRVLAVYRGEAEVTQDLHVNSRGNAPDTAQEQKARADRIAKRLPGVRVAVVAAGAKGIPPRIAAKFRANPDGKAMFDEDTATIYLGTQSDLSSLPHEVFHAILHWSRTKARGLHGQLSKLLSNPPASALEWAKRHYPGATADALREEACAELWGRALAEEIAGEERREADRLADALAESEMPWWDKVRELCARILEKFVAHVPETSRGRSNDGAPIDLGTLSRLSPEQAARRLYDAIFAGTGIDWQGREWTDEELPRRAEDAEREAEPAPAKEPAPILSGDEVRKTMPGYDPADWRTHVDRTGYVGPRMEARFQELLKTRKGKGNGQVVFLAGGNGVGKSTVAATLGTTPDFVIDSTLGNIDVAHRQIDAILANGQRPVIVFVYRTPAQALDGIAERMKHGGHVVSPLSFANSHTQSIRNLGLLAREYGDRIGIEIHDNSVEGAPRITLEQLEAKGIPNHDELRKLANEKLSQFGHELDHASGATGAEGSGGAEPQVEGGGSGGEGGSGSQGEEGTGSAPAGLETPPAGGTPAQEDLSAKTADELRTIAKGLFIKTGGKNKARLIAEIQAARASNEEFLQQVERDTKTAKPGDEFAARILDAIDTDARDGLVGVFADNRFGDGAYVANYADGSLEEVQRAADGIRKAFPDMEVLASDTGLVVKPKKETAAEAQPQLAATGPYSREQLEAMDEDALREIAESRRIETAFLNKNTLVLSILRDQELFTAPEAEKAKPQPATEEQGEEPAGGPQLLLDGKPLTKPGQGTWATQKLAELWEHFGNRDQLHSFLKDLPKETLEKRDEYKGALELLEKYGDRLTFGALPKGAESGNVESNQQGEENEPTVQHDTGKGQVDAERGHPVGARESDDGTGGGEVPGNGPRPDNGHAESGERRDNSGEADEVAGEGVGENGAGAQGANGERRGRNADNHVITDPDFLDAGGAKAKFRDNLAALRVLKTLREEGREATPEEREIIAKYVGWGRSEFRNGLFAWYGGEWQKEREELEELIGRDEFESARKSTLTAFWTPPRMAQAVWRALDRLGFKGGRVHEPSIGTGIFYGTMPTDIRDRSVLSGADKDVLATEIARALYPGAKITNGAYQEENLPDDFYDLVVGNFPFADFTIRRDKYNRVSANLHDYFWLKSLGIVRPGGLVAAITSTGTMDKSNDAVRREIADKADVVAAIRLPEGTFSGVAGTEVVTDLIILRKREPGTEMSADTKAWLETVPYSDLGKGLPGQVNQYYKLHPGNIVGTPTERTGRFGQTTTIKLGKGESAQDRLDAILAGLPENIYSPRARKTEAPKTASAAELGVDASTLRDGSLVAKDGEIWENTTQGLVQVKAPQNQKRKAKFLIELRDTLNALRSAEINDRPDSEIAPLRKELNRRYDAFVKEYGPLSKPGMLGIMFNDPSSHMLLALERSYDKEKNKAVKADIFTTRVGYAKSRATHAENYEQAAGFSMNETGRLDPVRVGEMMGVDTDTAERELLGKGLAYRAPDGQLVGSDEYLSGNVREKLRQAEAAARLDPAFNSNVEALRKVLPADKGPGDITVNLGATWVPPDVMSAFVSHVLGVPAGENGLAFEYNHALGRWTVSMPADKYSAGLLTRSAAWSHTYATEHRSFTDILDAALHDQRIRITRRDPYTGETEFLAVESEEANTKADKLKDEFLAWIWKDKDRATRLARIYNDTFNGFVERKKGGRWLTFPGIAPSVKLRAHQIAAVEKMLASRRLLMAHEVGTGKTYTYGLMARKAKETGSASKPLLVVTNSTIKQVAAQIQGLFPDMNIFVGGESMSAARRKRSMAQIANNNWDLVILTHDNLASLDSDPAVERKFIDGQISELIAAADAAAHSGLSKKEADRIKRNLLKRVESLNEKLKSLLKAPRTDGVATFQDLGFDMVMVDECQAFKKLPIATYRSRVKGIPTEGSKRASALLMNIENLLDNNPEACIVFGSGTPLDNSLVEAYVWQRYLQNDLLKSAGITSFDAWASNFGRTTGDLEMSPSGDGWKEVERFKEFVNLGELSSMMRQNMDVVFAKDTGEIVRPTRHDSAEEVPESESSRKVMAELAERAKALQARHGKPQKGEDNMLVICGDGRKAAVHPGLYKPEYVNAKGTKADACIKRVAANHKADPKAAQMIFCDCGVNDTEWGFNLYRFLRDGLIKAGFKPSQIAFFSSNLPPAGRAALAEKMNKGEVLVAIGSTDTMGTGINAQTRLRWMHHLDASRMMTPGSIEQRNGRGHRQGNTYKDVEVVTYIQVRSLDAHTWQLIKNKSGFIGAFMRGENLGSIEEESDTLQPDQFVAMASGDPRVFRKAQLEKQLHRLRLQEAAFEQSQRDQAADKRNSEWQLKNLDGEIKSLQAAVEVAAGTTGKPFSAEVVGSGGTGRTFTERDAALSSALGTAVDAAATRLKDTEWRRASDRATVAKYRGFDIQVGWEQQLGSSGPRLRYYLEMPDGTRTAYYLSPNFGDDKKTQMLAVFRSADAIIGGLKRKLQGAVEDRANIERRIGELSAGLDRKFENAGKITSIELQLQQINDALSGKDKEKKEGDRVENPEESAPKFQRGAPARDWSTATIPEMRRELVARGLSPAGGADVLRARLSQATQPSPESQESHPSKFQNGADTRLYFEKPFAESLREVVKPGSAVRENVYVRDTPKVFRDIGMTPLPIMASPRHLRLNYYGAGDFTRHFGNLRQGEHAHGLGFHLEALPKMLENPIAIVANFSQNATPGSVVALTQKVIRGRRVVVPVLIEAQTMADGRLVDSHLVLTVYDKADWVDKFLKPALEAEKKKDIGVFYVDAQQAGQFSAFSVLPKGSGKGLLISSVVHRIDEPGSPVKGVFKQQTDTAQFKRWFGKSKVVDTNGRPLVVYHGTNSEFWEFDPERVGENYGIDREGFFFTDDRVDADNYADDKVGMTETGKPRTIAAFLKMENPLVVEAEADAWSNPDGAPNTYYDERKDELLARMREGAHDGIIVRGKNGQRMFVVFDPNQIKSATDNIGTFSPRNDIRFQRGGTPPVRRDWSAAKIPELRRELVARGLSPAGGADRLRQRLADDDAQRQGTEGVSSMDLPDRSGQERPEGGFSNVRFQRGGTPPPIANPWDRAQVEYLDKSSIWRVVLREETEEEGKRKVKTSVLGRYATRESAEFALRQEQAVLSAASEALGKLPKARLAEIAEARRQLVDVMRRADATKEERADAIAAIGRTLGLHKDLIAKEWALAERILRTHDPESTMDAAEKAVRAVNTVLARASIRLHGRDMMRLVKQKAAGQVTGGLRKNKLLPVVEAWTLIRKQMTEAEKAAKLDEMDRAIDTLDAELSTGEGRPLTAAEENAKRRELAEKKHARELFAVFGGLASLHGGQNRARLAEDARAWAAASKALASLSDKAVQELEAKLTARAEDAKQKREEIIHDLTGGKDIPASNQEREDAKNARGWFERAREIVRGLVSASMGGGTAWGEVLTRDKSVAFGEGAASHLFHDGLDAGYRKEMEANMADKLEGLRILAQFFDIDIDLENPDELVKVIDFSEKCSPLFNEEAVDQDGNHEITVRSVRVTGTGKDRQVHVTASGPCTLKLGELMHFYLVGLQAEAAAGQAYTDTPKHTKGADCSLMEALVRHGYSAETMMEIRTALAKRGLDKLAMQISADMEKKGDALDALMASEYNSQLKRVHPYAPLRRLHWGLNEQGDAGGGGVGSFMSMVRSFMKERVANLRDFQTVNLIESWQSHNQQANHIIHLHDWISTVGRVMRHADMQTALDFVVGDRTRRALNAWLDIQARGGSMVIRDDDRMGLLARNFAVAVTTNPRIALKQLTSPGMALGMLPPGASTIEWFKDMARIAFPCEERRAFLAFLDGNSPEWRERGLNASDALSLINRHKAGSKYELLRLRVQRRLGAITRWGDRNGALLGCYGVFRAWERKFLDEGMEAGAAKIAALEKFDESVNAGQQSVLPEYMSQVQTMGGLYKYMTMFHTAQIAMTRNLYIHAKAWAEHRGNRREHERAIVGVVTSAWAFRLMGMGMLPLAQIILGILHGDPDKFKTGATKTLQEGVLSLVEAPASGVMPWGDAIVGLADRFVKGGSAWGRTGSADIVPQLSVLANVDRIVADFSKKADKRDWMAVARHASDFIGQTTGIPVTPAIDAISGTADAWTAPDLTPEQRVARQLTFSRSAIGAPKRKPAPPNAP